jgi:hypothetical protein
MAGWTRFVSPWSLAALAAWIVVLVVVANWAVPAFANVPSGPQCTLSVCPPTASSVEWLPVLLTGSVAATLVTGTAWAMGKRLERSTDPE